ncbi:MAG: hypothetical protein ABS55_07515 [Lautropia sp. SCN 70-15]|mgnify:CR=1 FL=1|jgi:mRNA interferase RelE/StbE|nr:MAG: hypothetical protein ABS55_07515 [Lautropia sp. SCN 70-15]
MPYRIELTRQAARALESMPANVRALLIGKIRLLAQGPHALGNNVSKLTGRNEFRLRVQDWRVIYRLFDDRMVLLIIKIGVRGDVYR